MKAVLSLGGILLVAFVTNHFFISKIDQTDRGVANFSERNNPKQIKWEHQVAADLAANKESVQASVKPNWQDQLVYEVLMGQYDIQTQNGMIQKISLQQSMQGVSVTTQQFVERFGKKIKDFDSYKINKVSSSEEQVQLFDKAGSSSGSFSIKRNESGRLINFDIQ